MGWKNVARIAADWADAKKTELLTTDRRTREDAEWRAQESERHAQEEADTSALEAVLPDHLARHVTANRPENVRAREEAERWSRLAGQDTARLELSITGDEVGTLEAELPLDRSVEEADPDDAASTAWLHVALASPHPLPAGTTTVCLVSLAFPGFAGPGSYDLRELHALGEAGVLASWEPLDTCVSPDVEVGDTAWFWDSRDVGRVDVANDGLTFELAMVSAVNRVRVRGRISWA